MGNHIGSATPPQSCIPPAAGGGGERAAVLRMIDANANRACEGLRVLDDVARFTLNDAALAAACKELRHRVRTGVASLGVDPVVLLCSRDTPGDVGPEATRLSGASSETRRGLADVARSAAGRAAESLRSLEEVSKVLRGSGTVAPSGASPGFEAMRYALYELERRLLGRLVPADASRQLRLCVLISESLCVHHRWEDVATMCLEAGADGLQLREKSLSDTELLARARALVSLAARHGSADRARASIIINDRPDIAVLSGADGVHVGQHDLGVRDIRRLFGHTIRVGVSTSCINDARRAIDDGADSCGVGPMYLSTTKNKDRIAGPAYLSEYLASPAGRLPHLAIGGISASNITPLVRAGCRGVAVSSAVCSSADPYAAARELLSLIPSSESLAAEPAEEPSAGR